VSEAIEVIRESGKASASLLQRRLKLGYARAARILDILEEKGVIGPADGAKPREVFLDQLGGVGSLEFAAREHNLTGELRPLENESEEEPTATVFTNKVMTDDKAVDDKEDDMPEDFLTDEAVDKEELTAGDDVFAAEVVADKIEEDLKTAVIPDEETNEVEEVEERIRSKDEDDLEDELVLPKASANKSKKFFSEDEWT